MSRRESFEWSRPHPWHGLDVGSAPPGRVDAFIEITPFDSVKYELDKHTGFLRVDRPQRTSSLPPSLYGFIPRTFCGKRVAGLAPGSVRGDEDPLDICVISERPISRAEVILGVRVVGGLPMIDAGEADDKIIGVLENDEIWGDARELEDLPRHLVARLRHYFSNYKTLPGEEHTVEVADAYGREHAENVILAAMADYVDEHSA
jgi:inorganic pyrophosphatase